MCVEGSNWRSGLDRKKQEEEEEEGGQEEMETAGGLDPAWPATDPGARCQMWESPGREPGRAHQMKSSPR